MPIDYKKINNLSNDGASGKAPRYPLNQIEFNGQSGVFVERKLLDEKDKDGKYPKVQLGEELKCVFLKHRRVLAQFRKNESSLNSNEHIGKDDYIFLFGVNEKGTASELREKYQGLRVRQIVYAYVPAIKEVVRLIVKGKSLVSDVKERFGYYDYLGSFDKEHSWQYFTTIKPVQLQGDLGSYYAMEFVRGEKLDDEKLQKVANLIEDASSKISVIEAYYKSKAPQEIVKESSPEDKEKVEYPDEEINADDIPF